MKINKILYFLDFPNGFGGAANTLLKQAEMVREYISDVLITIPLDDNGFTIKELIEIYLSKVFCIVYNRIS